MNIQPKPFILWYFFYNFFLVVLYGCRLLTVIPEFVCLPAAASSLQALTLNISSWPQPTSPYIMGEQGNEDGSCFIYLLSKHLFTQALHVRLLVANCADEREQTDTTER